MSTSSGLAGSTTNTANTTFTEQHADQLGQRGDGRAERDQMFGTTTVPRGTSAFIGKNANVHAGRNVDLDARERVDVKAVGGGFGVGGIGVGAGIVIVSLDERVQAFVDSGARHLRRRGHRRPATSRSTRASARTCPGSASRSAAR